MDVILDYTFFYSFSIKFLDFGNFGMKCFGAVGRSHNKLTKGLIFFFAKGYTYGRFVISGTIKFTK